MGKLVLFLSSLIAASLIVRLAGADNNCEYDFKVYIYELPEDLVPLKLAEDARRDKAYHVCAKCIMEQFALEYIMVDFFSNFCGRTKDPEEADFFYLPVVRDVEYRQTLYSSSKGPKRAPSRMDNVLIQAMEKDNMEPWKEYLKITDRYWLRNKGADHIIVMPAPVTNLRHQTGARGFSHYMIQLHRPIFLNVEFSKTFLREYQGACTDKNLVLPYPTVDPDLYNGKYMKPKANRDKLLYYHGGHHGSCVFIREALNEIQRNTSLTPGVGGRKREQGYRRAKFCPIPIGDSPSSKRQYDVMNYGCVPIVLSDDLVFAFTTDAGGIYNESDFSIRLPQKTVQIGAPELNHQNTYREKNSLEPPIPTLPLGTKLTDKLLLLSQEAMARGPMSEDAYRYPGGRKPKYPFPNTLQGILERIPDFEIENIQKNVIKMAKFYRYYKKEIEGGLPFTKIPTEEHRLPDGGAIVMLAKFLTKRKRSGIAKAADECDIDRNKKHNFRGAYPCVKYKLDGQIQGQRYKPSKPLNKMLGVVGEDMPDRRRLHEDDDKDSGCRHGNDNENHEIQNMLDDEHASRRKVKGSDGDKWVLDILHNNRHSPWAIKCECR